MTTDPKNGRCQVPVPTRLSHDIELQFLVAYVHTSDVDPDHNGVSILPPILRVNSNASAAEGFIISHMVATLRDNDMRVKKQGQSHDDVWVVCSSSASRHDMEEDVVVHNSGRYRWLAIELRSPVFWDELCAYEEARLVVNLLKSKYRLRVNATCGFHVGIGNGSLYFDTRTLKRAAAFLFTSDPILSRLHVPWRRIGAFSASIRYASLLACWKGVKPSDADKYAQEMARSLLDQGCILDPLPVVPWSDQSRNEKDFGGKDNWERHANTLVTNGPLMALSDRISSDPRQLREFVSRPSRDSEDSMGGAWYRRLQRYMMTPMFRAACVVAFKHDRVNTLSPQEQYYVLQLAQCQTLYGHMDLLRLDDSEIRFLVSNCAPYTENTWMTGRWDPVSGCFTVEEARIGDELDHPKPLAYNEIIAPKILRNLARQISPQHMSSEGESGTSEEDTSDSEFALTSGEFMPDAWDGLHNVAASDFKSPLSEFELATFGEIQSILDNNNDGSSRQASNDSDDSVTGSAPSSGDFIPGAWQALYNAAPSSSNLDTSGSGQPGAESDNLGTDSVPSSDGFMPAAWQGLRTVTPPNANNASLSELEIISRSEANSVSDRDHDSSSGRETGDETGKLDSTPAGDSLGSGSSSPFLSQVSTPIRSNDGNLGGPSPPLLQLSTPDRNGGSNKSSPPLLHRVTRSELIRKINKISKKFAPHDVSQLDQSYMDLIATINGGSLLRYGWQRIPWLPGPDCRVGRPDPAPPRAFDEEVCRGGNGNKCKEHPVTDTLTGVAVITETGSAAALAYLLSNATTSTTKSAPLPLNYDFHAYEASELGKAGATDTKKRTRTLVFREAAGSLDAEWIITWTRICHGIVRFCRDASVFDFLLVIERVASEEYWQRDRRRSASSEQKVGVLYDVCDLLEDIGLFGEAAFVRRQEKRSGPPR